MKFLPNLSIRLIIFTAIVLLFVMIVMNVHLEAIKLFTALVGTLISSYFAFLRKKDEE